MSRPWKIWLIFACCAAVMLAVMGWVSGMALRLDRSQARAQAQAELEGRIRLALWRMDSMLSPVIAQESARPYFTYSAIHPAERAYGRMFNTLDPGEVLVPSPLLTQVSTNILLHFQIDPQGRLTSPQAPMGNQRDLAEAHQFTTHERIELAAARLREFEGILAQEAPPELRRMAAAGTPHSDASAEALPRSNRSVLLAVAPSPDTGANVLARNSPPMMNSALTEQLQAGQFKSAGQMELQARAQSVQQAFGVNLQNTFANAPVQDRLKVVEGLFKPVWFGNTLVLVRRVSVQGEDYVQGCWVDWAGLRQWLLDGVKDLLPTADLAPITGNGSGEQTRMLAALPVQIAPGPISSAAASTTSPIRVALALGWICVLTAGLAVALLLQGTLSLSERRAAFVSAVTHELRTPLTTFKMYSEMLAGGMVSDKSRQQEYLSTLCAEASRLNHLVENVLAYARLERGSARSRIETITLRDLIERVKPRLLQRAEQAGMILQNDTDAGTPDTRVHVDVSVVEQILFNLVDNACKYAGPDSEPRVIHLEAFPGEDGFALLRVRDHGQGISPEAARKLFRPFSKSASEAARTAPGVGLGLALCRRLGRSLGGDLRFKGSGSGGACFELLLPAARL